MHYGGTTAAGAFARSRNGTCLIMINKLTKFVLFNTKLRGGVFACTDMNMLMAQIFCVKPRQQDCFESRWHGHED